MNHVSPAGQVPLYDDACASSLRAPSSSCVGACDSVKGPSFTWAQLSGARPAFSRFPQLLANIFILFFFQVFPVLLLPPFPSGAFAWLAFATFLALVPAYFRPSPPSPLLLSVSRSLMRVTGEKHGGRLFRESRLVRRALLPSMTRSLRSLCT